MNTWENLPIADLAERIAEEEYAGREGGEVWEDLHFEIENRGYTWEQAYRQWKLNVELARPPTPAVR